jgi:hypothetical protein
VVGGKIDLFISKVAPNLVRRFLFQAQYRFNRPARPRADFTP